MTSTTAPECGAEAVEELDVVTAALYRLQVQHAHLMQHLAVTHDLNPIDMRLLKVLGVDSEPRTPKELGQFLEIGTGTVTAMIDRLEARRFISRKPNPNDRRSSLVHLEPCGITIVNSLRQVYQDALTGLVTPSNRNAIITALHALEAHFTDAATATHATKV